jgi:hypothetical protein
MEANMVVTRFLLTSASVGGLRNLSGAAGSCINGRAGDSPLNDTWLGTAT